MCQSCVHYLLNIYTRSALGIYRISTQQNNLHPEYSQFCPVLQLVIDTSELIHMNYNSFKLYSLFEYSNTMTSFESLEHIPLITLRVLTQ